MDNIPLSYANFLLLWVLQRPSHGYEIMKIIETKTNNLVSVGPATMYRSLSYFLENGYITLISESDNKKKYILTDSGKKLLKEQINFFELISNIVKERV